MGDETPQGSGDDGSVNADQPKKALPISPAKAAEKARLAAALRDNLKRRKAQVSARKTETIAEQAKPEIAE
jgi:hypothetical protein